MAAPGAMARKAFAEDLAFKLNHIKTRCKAIAKEREEQARLEDIRDQKRKEMEQDPTKRLDVEVPEGASERERQRAEAFNSFSTVLQQALVSGDADNLQTVLSEMEEKEQQRVLKLCAETGLLEVVQEDEV